MKMTPFLSAAALSTKFPSLPFTKPMLGVYFAASWCPDCTGVTPKVAQVLEATSTDWDVVYVASDNTEEQVKSYVPTSFSVVPFTNEEERSELKRHFGACAGKEAGPLGVERKFGIPTLIVLESVTGKVITTGGVQDIMRGTSAVENWKTQLSVPE